MMFSNIKIVDRLFLGFVSIVIVSILIGYIGYKGMNVIQSHLNDVTNIEMPGIHALLLVNHSLAVIDAAENALLIAQPTPELIQSSYEKIENAKDVIEAEMKIYDSLPRKENEDAVWKEFLASKNEWLLLQNKFMEMVKGYYKNKTAIKYNEISHYALVTHAPVLDKTVNLLTKLVEITDISSHDSSVIGEKQSRSSVLTLIVVILVGAVFSIFLGLYISKKIATNIENLNAITIEIKNGVEILGTSSAEILTTVTEISTGAAETATSVSETTTTVEEVRQTAMVSSQKAQSLMVSSQKAADSVEKGRESIHDVIESMKKIDNQMNLISETVLKLADQNRTVGEITSSVADIADQSNLLAVNAAIEAAKAGEHGRGFTVVAQEIRSLADQSKKATAQVKEILNEINKSVNQAVGVTEQGSRTVEEGRRLVAQSGEVIEILSENVEEAAQAAIQISSSNQQQMAGMEQIVPAMENIKLASQQNVTGIKQVQIAAHDLSTLGKNLKEISQKFKQ